MSTTINALAVRKKLDRKTWSAPTPFGPDGWRFDRHDNTASIIVSAADWDADGIWIHASIAYRDHTPSYDDLVLLHRAVFGDGYAYQVFAPADDHVNIHAHALHLWGRADGARVTPDFGKIGSI